MERSHHDSYGALLIMSYFDLITILIPIKVCVYPNSIKEYF
jgi:hypothetical protein